jgi:replicative DNA helicase
LSSRYEQALIGTVLVKPTLTGDVSDVRKTDMSSRSHQILWETIISLNNGGRLSPQAVIEKLIADGAMVNLGGDVDDGELVGEEYIRDIMARGAEISVREFADQVINSSVKRSLREVGQLIALDAQGEGEADKIMDEVEKKLIELRRTRVDDGIEIGELLGTFSTRMNQWREGTFIPAMKFHTPGVAHLIPFLEEEDYMICAGRPGEGKSSLIRFEAFKSATLDGKKVAIINLENSDLEYARYFIAFITGINSKKLRDPKLLTDLEIIKVKQAIQELRKAPIRIVSMGSPTVFEIGRVMRKLAKEGYEIFFVDYLQLIQNGAENENANITITSTVLRGYAKIMRRPS